MLLHVPAVQFFISLGSKCSVGFSCDRLTGAMLGLKASPRCQAQPAQPSGAFKVAEPATCHHMRLHYMENKFVYVSATERELKYVWFENKLVLTRQYNKLKCLFRLNTTKLVLWTTAYILKLKNNQN